MRNAKFPRALATLVAVIGLLAGCVPVLRTVQPGLTIDVTDSEGDPVEGASVQVGTYKWPFGGRNTIRVYNSNSNGTAKTKRIHEWDLIVILPDGVNTYTWQLCIEKAGYRPAVLAVPERKSRIKVSLAVSETPMICQWPDDSEGRLRPPLIVAGAGSH